MAKKKVNKKKFHPIQVSVQKLKVTDVKPMFRKRVDTNRIIGALQNVDMRYSNNGLGFIISKFGLKPENIPKGNWFLFVNSSRTMMKMLGHRGVILSYPSPSGRLDMNAFKHISEAFNDEGDFNFEKAIRASIEEKLYTKGRRQLEA